MLVTLFGGESAHADQTDPRLQELFKTLRLAPDEVVAEEAERRITQMWHEGANPELTSDLNKAKQLIESWSFEAAMKLLDDLAQRAPQFAEVWNQRATLHFIQRNYAASLADIDRTLALEPRHFGALSGLGQIRLKSGDRRGALEAFERTFAVHPYLPALKYKVEVLRKEAAED